MIWAVTVILQMAAGVVVDVTPLLKGHLYNADGTIQAHESYLIRFNPSIVPIHGEYYLLKYHVLTKVRNMPMSYDAALNASTHFGFRELIYGPSHRTQCRHVSKRDQKWADKPAHMSPLHPWFGGMWHMVQFDGIGFAILRVHPNLTVTVVHEVCNVSYHGPDVLNSVIFEGDERLVSYGHTTKKKKRGFKYLITGDRARRKGQAIFAYVMTLRLDNENHISSMVFDLPLYQSTSAVCSQSWGRDIRMPYGRNWALFTPELHATRKLEFLYQLFPTWRIQQTDHHTDQCQLLTPPLAYPVDKLYLSSVNSHRYALGTPLIKWSATEYLGVGHSRYSFFGNKSDHRHPVVNTSNWRVFTTLLQKHKENGTVTETSPDIYFMFFYTININTREVSRMSHSFLEAPHLPYWLQFASGLCKSHIGDDTFIISYGEGDCRVKLLFRTRQSIDRQLMNASEMVRTADAHRFRIM